MSEQEHWRHLIDKAERPKFIEAISLLQKEDGTFNTARWMCDDGEKYVVKMPQPEAIRISVNEQIPGRFVLLQTGFLIDTEGEQ